MDKVTKNLIIANCMRIIEILETADDEVMVRKYGSWDGQWGYKEVPKKKLQVEGEAELRNKMLELRRDTIRFEKSLR